MPKIRAVGNEGLVGLLIQSWRRSLHAQNLSVLTIRGYIGTARAFNAFLIERGMPTDPSALSREHVETFLGDLLARMKANSVRCRYQQIGAFFRWLVDIGEIQASPMDKMHPPRVSEPVRPVLSDEVVRRILHTCEGKSFYERRDHAILRLFVDTGLRVAEMAALRLDDIDWDAQSITVRKGKGAKGRIVYFGRKSAKALDSYVYLKGGRREHKDRELPGLWLGIRGAIMQSTIYLMVRERGQQAGVEGCYPHLFRHYFVHASLKSGMQESDVMRQSGHTSSTMMRRYGAAAADERARSAHRKWGPGDLL